MNKVTKNKRKRIGRPPKAEIEVTQKRVRKFMVEDGYNRINITGFGDEQDVMV